MPANRVQCTSCDYSIVAGKSADWVEQECPSCHTKQSALVFPAIRGILAASPQGIPVAPDGFASCFFHSGKPASIPCDNCGRFLCDLCDLKIDERHLCTLCLQTAQEEKASPSAKSVTVTKERTFLPQNLAMILTFYMPVSIVGLYIIFLTAPAAAYVSVRYWNHPGGIQQRGRWRLVACLVVALAQILGFLALAYLFYMTFSRQGLQK